MITQILFVLLNRLKSLALLLVITFIVSACTQGNSTVTTQQQSGGNGIAVPSALLSLPIGGGLTAYIRVDEGERQLMAINDGMASITLSGITEGTHTFTLEFEYSIINPDATVASKSLIIASASKTMDIGPGDNILNIPESDYDLNFDEDGDGESNLDEIANGSSPFAGITVATISGNTAENGTTATFSVVLTSLPTNDVTIAVSSLDTSEGVVSQATIIFTSTNWNDPQTIIVTGIDDDIVDGSMGYNIQLAVASSDDADYDGLDPNDVVVINTDNDNDSAGFTISTISGNTTEAGATASFTVALTSAPTADVTIAISSSDPTEGTIDSSAITFTTANWNTAQTVTVTGIDDNVADANQTFTIQLVPAISLDSLYDGQNPTDVLVINLDNETPGFSVSPISGDTSEEGATATFTVALISEPTTAVTIGINSSDTTEGVADKSSITFSASSWNIAQTVTVTGLDDGITDGDQSYAIILAAATSSDANYSGLKPNDILLTNIDKNFPPSASNVSIIDDNAGSIVIGDSLTGSYTFVDVNSDPEGVSTYRWLRNGAAIGGATALTYTLMAADGGQIITFEVTPVATTGASNSTAVVSSGVTVELDTAMLSLNFGIKQLQFSWSAVNNAMHYKLMKNPDGVSGFTQVGEDITTTSSTVDIAVHRQDWVNARYLVQACDVNGCSSSNEVSTLGGVLSAIGYVKASNTGEYDSFGTTVALSGDGNTLAVGVQKEDSNATGISTDGTGEGDNSASEAGAVYVFSRSGGSWVQQAYIKASNTETSDGFGTSVALSGDGNTLAVGAAEEDSNATGISTDGTGEDDNSGRGAAGAVYVFSRSGGSWVQQAYVKASNAGQEDLFGSSVALSSDGNTLAVGAQQEDSNATGISTDGTGENNDLSFNSGAVYVFSRSGGSWVQQAYVKSSNAGSRDWFGTSVALSSDGNTLAVGVQKEDSNATGISTDGTGEGDNSAYEAGAVYVFIHNGSSWFQQAYVKASNTETDDYFGISVALSGDGKTLAVGAAEEDSNATGISTDGTGEDDNSVKGTGAVYVFNRSGGSWVQQAYVKASNAERGDEFGSSVSLSSDGNTLAVGTDREYSNATGISTDETGEDDNSAILAGAVYVFSRNAGSWVQQAYVKASNAEAYDLFGTSVGLSGDGNTLAVGALGEGSYAIGVTTGADAVGADNSASNAGAVYLY
ncbi:MAG: FG-GAP repeat protein [Ectothiorhodospiraceae bacterium]|nr:FG-GAP repeat protein [Ectothiorhodospiraceae bacterium]